MLKHRFNGFTLIELILVIVIVGIVGISTTQFIKSSAEIYITSVKLDEVLGQARFALIRLGKELRRATPNSIRVTEDVGSENLYQCLEFAPIKASSIYVNGNAEGSKKLEVVINNDIQTDEGRDLIETGDLVAIYPQTAADIYVRSNNKVHPLEGSPDEEQEDQTQLWSFENSFAVNSPSRRLFVLQSSPVSICIESGGLYYYSGSGYNYSAVQPQPSKEHVLSNIQGQLLAKHIKNLDVFSVNDKALMGNSIVTIKLEMKLNQSESFVHSNDIYIQNVP